MSLEEINREQNESAVTSLHTESTSEDMDIIRTLHVHILKGQ